MMLFERQQSGEAALRVLRGWRSTWRRRSTEAAWRRWSTEAAWCAAAESHVAIGEHRFGIWIDGRRAERKYAAALNGHKLYLKLLSSKIVDQLKVLGHLIAPLTHSLALLTYLLVPYCSFHTARSKLLAPNCCLRLFADALAPMLN